MGLRGWMSIGVRLCACLVVGQLWACLPDEQPQQVLGFQPVLPDDLSADADGSSLSGNPLSGNPLAGGAVPFNVAQGGLSDPSSSFPNSDSTSSPSPAPSLPAQPPVTQPPSTQPPSTQQPDPPPAEDPPVPMVKIPTAVGLSPRSLDASGYIEAIDRAAQCSDIALVQVTFAWDFLRGASEGIRYRAAYDWMIAPDASGRDILQRHDLGRAFWLSFTDPLEAQRIAAPGVNRPVTFTDPEVRAAFVDECAWFAGHFQPDYLAIGVEIESFLAAVTPAERSGFLAAFVSARDACKAAWPQCRVFMYFQYENVRARDLWSIIAPFAQAGDAYAFSSYPSLPMSGANTGHTSATLSETYYDEIAVRLGSDRPVVIAELGHPATACSYFAAGSEPEQAAMIDGAFRSLRRLDTALVAWTYLHDPDLSSVYDPASSEYFGSMGLQRSDQTQSGGAGWDAWIGQ